MDFVSAAQNFTSQNDAFTLSDGNQIPCLGFGTWRVKDSDNGAAIISEAIRAGYRHFDTAAFYGSEGSVGDGIASSGLSRADFFVTTKIWKSNLNAAGARASVENSLRLLKSDYVDLLLIHWPRASAEDRDWQAHLIETWDTVRALKKEGKARSIGVSNFLPHHLKVLGDEELPAVDQLEFHIGYLQSEACEYCKKQGILVEAWSPLGKMRTLQNPTVTAMAEKYGISTARLCLAFNLTQGVLSIPKSADPERMRDNLNCFGIKLAPEDISALKAIDDPALWSGEHPDPELARKVVV